MRSIKVPSSDFPGERAPLPPLAGEGGWVPADGWAVGARERQVRPEVERESTCVRQTPSRLLALQFSRVRLCDPMNRSAPGLPVHHQLPGITQTHAHLVGDAIQPAPPLSSPSPPDPIPPSIRVFSSESALLALREPKSEDAQASAKGGKKMHPLDAHTRQHAHHTLYSHAHTHT